MAKSTKPTTRSAKLQDDPNSHREPVTKAQTRAEGALCKYLGQYYRPGEKICHKGKEHECRGGSWRPTGNDC